MLKFLKILVGNYKAKIFASVVASFLFFYVISDNLYKTDFDVPVNVINLKADETVVSKIPETVNVTFEGNGRDLMTFLIRLKYVLDVRFNLDVSAAGEGGRYDLEEQIGLLQIPSNLAIQPLSVNSPQTVVIKTEKTVRKKIPVIADIEIDPAAGFVLVGDITVSPDSVFVRLPRSYSDSVQYVEAELTRHLDVDKDIRATLALNPPRRHFVTYETGQVVVTADIQKLAETTIKNVPVTLLNAPQGVSVEPSSLSLQVKGGVEVLARLSPDQISAVVDYKVSGDEVGGNVVPLIELPKGITWSELRPRKFRIVNSN